MHYANEATCCGCFGKIEPRVQSPLVQSEGQKKKSIKKKIKKKPRDTLEVTSSVETHSACP